MRLIYIDDSGAQESGLAVYAWVEVLDTDWRRGLRCWLDWRRDLHTATGVPASYELHATRFRPTGGTPWDHSKANRTEVMADAFRTIAALPGVRVGAVFRETKGTNFTKAKADLYSDLITMLDERLHTAGELGMVFMDGDGTDPAYRLAHRGLKLDTRCLLEDPSFQGSHTSQWVQQADLIAYAAFMTVLRADSKRVMWQWYPNILGEVCALGGMPQPL
ncbi:DUF3800 domain-containing protein [Allokutzneria sp. NRRL B-24872]|uniref:DUF3800 domain-containing protein n=1 Tax=Allokutzneria sp. NRRL B-24872 TaxID=1137961 RepID=UPI000A375E5A|nr:DUF3800 domain-containing protein [Allokutzneria sp. NRRL B-24872]